MLGIIKRTHHMRIEAFTGDMTFCLGFALLSKKKRRAGNRWNMARKIFMGVGCTAVSYIILFAFVYVWKFTK